MARHAWIAELRPGCEEEHERRHDEIWPEMPDALRRAGVRDDWIFRHGLRLVLAFERDDVEAVLRAIAADPVDARWGEAMAPLLRIGRDPRTGLPSSPSGSTWSDGTGRSWRRSRGMAHPNLPDGLHPLEEADVAVTLEASRHRDHPLVRALGALSEVADQPPALALSGGVLLAGLALGDRGLARTGARMLVGLGLAIAAKSAIKAVVVRTRPHKLLDEGHYETDTMGPNEGPWNSFPSGHAADAVVMARAVARGHPALALPAYAAAAAIGAVQVPQAKHYPIDVAAGAVVGLAAEAMASAAVGLAEDRLTSRRLTQA